jgi:hypothetical protein
VWEKEKTRGGSAGSSVVFVAGGNRPKKSTPMPYMIAGVCVCALLSVRQRQWVVVEQPRSQWQLLVCLVQLVPQRSEPELQQWWSQPAEQQQSVQRLRRQGGAALISFRKDKCLKMQTFLFPRLTS